MRAIQNQVKNPLAQEILAGWFGECEVTKVDVEVEGLVFRKQSPR